MVRISSRSHVVLCRSLLSAILILIAGMFGACGGGSASSVQPTPPPSAAADFALSMPNASVTLQQNGASQGLDVGATPSHGFKGTITLSFSPLPNGVTATAIGSGSIASGSGIAAFQFSGSANAAVGSYTITVTGTSGSLVRTATFALQVKPAAPFTLQVTPTVLNMVPGSRQTVQVSVVAVAGTSPSLIATLPSAPLNTGFTIGNFSGLLTPQSLVSFTVDVTSFAQPISSFPITINAADGSGNSTTLTVPLSIHSPFPPLSGLSRSTFVRTDAVVEGMVYDAMRKVVFASAQTLNQVAVFSSVDGHRVASIPLPSPAGIDEAADGSAVYVTSYWFSGVWVIDPSTMKVIRHSDNPTLVQGQRQTYQQPVALSNGEVLLNPTSNSAPNFTLWNPATDQHTPTGVKNDSAYGTYIVTRSADHKHVLAMTGTSGVIYHAETNSFTGPDAVTGTNCAINGNGTQIFCAEPQDGTNTFYDGQLNVIASLEGEGATVTAVNYSTDGTTAYAFGSLGTGLEETAGAAFDTSTHAEIGLIPAPALSALPRFSQGSVLTTVIDETGMVFAPAKIGDTTGIAFVDVSSPGTITLPAFFGFTLSTDTGSVHGPTSLRVNGTAFDTPPGATYKMFFGAPPTSAQTQSGSGVSVVSDTVIQATAPSGKVQGPANVTLLRSDGYSRVIPDGISFGPVIFDVDTNAGSTAGGDKAHIYGMGFDPSTAVSIGGKPATINSSASGLEVNTPAGLAGAADVAITTAGGATTKTGGFTYVQTATYPIGGSLAHLIYDKWRQRVYLANADHNQIEVFDVNTRTLLSPITVGVAPIVLALTTDGAYLAVQYGSGSVGVIDLTSMTAKATYSALSSSDTRCASPGYAGLAAAMGHRMLVTTNCTNFLDVGVSHFLNLDTGSLSCAGITNCGSDGVTFFSTLGRIVSSNDGTKIAMGIPCDGSEGPLVTLDLTKNQLSRGMYGGACDVSVGSDGLRFAKGLEVGDQTAWGISSMAVEPWAYAGVNSTDSLLGEQLSPSGALLFVPQGSAYASPKQSSVAIFDVHTGRLRQRIAMPQDIPSVWGALALDDTGSRLFVISTSGMMITELPPMLSLQTVSPASASAGTTLTLRGSGFVNGATVSFGTLKVDATFVDANTITVVVPSVSSGGTSLTVTNPSGEQYSFDNAVAVN